jgi:hypothetical protein
MSQRVDARDVLDADAATSRALTGRVVGFFRRIGPNAWDEYELVEEDGGPIDVYAGTPIQVEGDGATFRMRRRGEVLRVAWTPDDGGPEAGGDLRARFLASCVSDEDPTPEGNLAVWLHGKLRDKPEPND